MTPCGTWRNNLKPSGRKLWNSDKQEPGKPRPPIKYRNSRSVDEWDDIFCPQFVDFGDEIQNGDSFFGKHRMIVSTPEVKNEPRTFTHSINENAQIETSQKCRNSGEDKGGKIVNPEFVEFANLPKISDSFFGKHMVIVSTPKVDGEYKSSIHSYNENTLIESLGAFSLSSIGVAPPEKKGQNSEDISVSTMEQSVDNVTVISVQTKEPKNHMEVNKQLKIATSAPRFHGRDERQQNNKPERIKKNLEEDRKQFRANPLPEYLIARKMQLNKNKNNSPEKIDCDVDSKERKLQCPDKKKENTEVWKKPAFVPYQSQKNAYRPKSPPLRTKGRAEERKKFDQSVKENQMKAKLQRQMDLEAKREQEQKEIALLRKQTVHKAQPIRKYKDGLPKIQKRALTDPQTPLTLKRRRV